MSLELDLCIKLGSQVDAEHARTQSVMLLLLNLLYGRSGVVITQPILDALGC